MTETTNVKTVDFESLSEFFPESAPDPVTPVAPPVKSVFDVADDIEVPEPEDKIDPVAPVKPVVPATSVAPAKVEPGESFEDILEGTAEENAKAGKPKTDKSGIVQLYKKKIADGQMVPFDDFTADSKDEKYQEKLEEYLSKLSLKDMEELWDANQTRKQEELERSVPQQFFESLPEELQVAAKYVADGGTDLKGLFKALSQVAEIQELDPVKSPREVAYQYLSATQFGTDAEIKEQLDEWEDMGVSVITKKAQAFKPKLDKMQEQIVQQKQAQQEQANKYKLEQAQAYYHNVTTALKEPTLGNLKLDKKTHDFLVQGLIQPAYKSQLTGKDTHMLGYLLEKYQVIEPNYPLVAEALWLLSDPDGYRGKLIEQGASAKAGEVARKLKQEQNNRQAAGNQDLDAPGYRSPVNRNSVPRSNVLKR